MIWLSIFAMTLVIFFSRYLFLSPGLPLKISDRLRDFLSFSAPAVLTALCAPIIFLQGGELRLDINNPYLSAAIVAVLLAYFSRKMLLTVIVSFLVFFLLK
ncbi:AzlD domain-containing protein [Veronia pacifica]|uniref:Branched-chain amino acid ABC transporter n=1 Tax=Veronia pacifica TaxID=1080227 RepID=A0A1C3ESR8_9GAMM|nr:AzlD domain-containing protein [Veronia pacifica]ODA36235.1 branched-chain amino acid ABC transporter [Veronia pacifica]